MGLFDFQTFVYLCLGFFGWIFLITGYETFLIYFCETCLYWFDFEIQIDKKEIMNLPSKLIIVSSHTSVYDFVFSFLVYSLYFRQKYVAYIVMKKSFEEYVTPFLKWTDSKLKMIRVDPSQHGLTKQIVNQLKDKDHYILGIAPEGTRRCVPELRKGYFYLAKELNCKVLYIGIDFEKRKIRMEDVHEVSEEWEKERDWFIEKCKKYMPLYPDQCYWTRDEYLEECEKIESSSIFE